MKKLAIITTHPIQYNAPWFRLLAERGKVQLKVFYTWGELVLQNKYDPGFGKNVEWDIPLLEGYESTFVNNIANDPGSHHFRGIDNPALMDELKEWNPEAILVFGWAFKSHLKVIRYFNGKIPILFRGDSTLLDEVAGFSVKKILRSIFLKWVYRHIDYALYVGSANKAYYQKFGLKGKQLVFAPHAIDNKRFAENREKEVAKFRASIGVSNNDILLLFAGKLEPKKNPKLLLEAFTIFGNHSFHLLFVGNGVEEEFLKKKVKEEILENVSFINFQNQQIMPVVYQSADIFCLPSQGPGETWGLAVNEAMAGSKAVLVSSKCGCAQDLVKPGINGYVFESNNLKDLISKIKMIGKNKEQISEMGKESFALIQDWNYEKICEAIEKIKRRESH